MISQAYGNNKYRSPKPIINLLDDSVYVMKLSNQVAPQAFVGSTTDNVALQLEDLEDKISLRNITGIMEPLEC